MVVHSGQYIPVSSRIHPSRLDMVIILPVLVLRGWTGGGGTGIEGAKSGIEGAESGVEGAGRGTIKGGVGSGKIGGRNCFFTRKFIKNDP